MILYRIIRNVYKIEYYLIKRRLNNKYKYSASIFSNYLS